MSQRKKQPNKNLPPQWRRMDLHLHTPASADYRESNVSYLDILKKAEQKGLDIIAITDHNTAAGYRRYLDEVQDLEMLERRNRLTDEEKTQLAEFRRLREKILVLPGFELTCTLGFHVLGIFPPETLLRELEHLLLDLHVPPEKLDVGSGEVGATSDVLTAYRLINQAGGLAIAAHANSSHGVAMPGFDFGGQTRIAYTQDENLHALEVTDLASKARRRTQMFFSGTKPEYPRKMHCIQGSDAHRLNGISGNNQELGVGDRPTEILLSEVSFDAIMDVLVGKDFSKTRPYVPAALNEFDPLYSAREEGDTLVQAFHASPGKHGIDRHILQDVVALANTNGGTVYIGASANMREQIQGVQKPLETAQQLRNEIGKHIVPSLDVQIDTLKTAGKTVLQMIVPRGSDAPYALDSTQIFVRSENETSLAVRDEIVNLVRDALAVEFAGRVENAPLEAVAGVETVEALVETQAQAEAAPAPKLAGPPPHTGVEIVSSKTRARGDKQYTMRDLRNNRIIHNVTRSSARKLWQYAIGEYEKKTYEHAPIQWLGEVGILKASERAGKVRYDLVQRDSSGELHVYYGVTDDGIHGVWKDLVESTAAQPVVEIEEEEAVMPAGEADEMQSADEMLASDATDIQDASETAFESTQAVADTNELTLSATEQAEPQDAPVLMTTPGRNFFPPPVFDLSPSTQETDDLPAQISDATLSALAENVADEPVLAQDVEIADTPVPQPESVLGETNMEIPQAEIFADVTALPPESVPVETALIEIPPSEPRAEIESSAQPGTLGIEMPAAVEIAQAPILAAPIVPTEIVSGETFAPITETSERGDMVPPVESQLPNLNVNLDDQIVLPDNNIPRE